MNMACTLEARLNRKPSGSAFRYPVSHQPRKPMASDVSRTGLRRAMPVTWTTSIGLLRPGVIRNQFSRVFARCSCWVWSIGREEFGFLIGKRRLRRAMLLLPEGSLHMRQGRTITGLSGIGSMSFLNG